MSDQVDRVYDRHLVRNSKLIDDDNAPQLTPLWSEQDYITMDCEFCLRMKKAIYLGTERARENKLLVTAPA